MAVHNSSVVAGWVNVLNPAFYTALTNQEEYLYNQASLVGMEALARAIQLFTDLMMTLTAWRNASTVSRSAGYLNAIPTFLYTYNMYKERFGMAGVSETLFDAKQVYDMGGFMDVVIARSVGHYNDLIEDPLIPLTYDSVKITADIAAMDAGVWMPIEKAKLDAVENNAMGSVRAMNGNALFGDLPAAPVGIVPKTKTEIAVWIFQTLNWKWVVDTLPAATMSIPAVILNPP